MPHSKARQNSLAHAMPSFLGSKALPEEQPPPPFFVMLASLGAAVLWVLSDLRAFQASAGEACDVPGPVVGEPEVHRRVE